MSGPALDSATAEFLARLTGVRPDPQPLWVEALTHGSLGEPRTYERLEFLGDRVLGLSIAEALFEQQASSEGQLSQRLNALVSREVCAAVARSVGLPDHIRMGKQARDDGGRDSDNILGDVVESLLGAVFLSRGYEVARDLVHKLWAEKLAGGEGERKHPKAALQEWAAGNKRKMPEYRIVDRRGPDHDLRFTVEVTVNGVGEARATGSSKQEAETLAAAEFMRKLG